MSQDCCSGFLPDGCPSQLSPNQQHQCTERKSPEWHITLSIVSTLHYFLITTIINDKLIFHSLKSFSVVYTYDQCTCNLSSFLTLCHGPHTHTYTYIHVQVLNLEPTVSNLNCNKFYIIYQVIISANTTSII